MSTGNTNLELLRRAKAGDYTAFGCYLLQQRAALLYYIRKHLTGEIRRIVDPEDVLQDVYLQAFQKIAGLQADDPRAAFRWLIQIARNQALLVMRAASATRRGGGRRPSNTGADDRYGESIQALLQDLAVHENTPSRSAMFREAVLALHQSIKQLPTAYEQVIRLHYLEGHTIDAVARKTGHTCGSVRMQCCRALRLLRRRLGSASLYM